MFEYLGRSSSTEVLKLCGRKGFINLALKTGSQVIPCYTFGCWDIFEVASRASPHLTHCLSSSLVDLQLEISSALLSPHRSASPALLGKIFPSNRFANTDPHCRGPV
jgi:hypothetical protein